MKQIYFFNSFFFLISLFSTTLPPYSQEQKFLVNQPTITLYEKPSKKSRFASQAVYGHRIYCLEDLGSDWIKAQTEEGYIAYCEKKALHQDQLVWRFSEKLCKVASLKGLVYLSDTTEYAPFLKLPYDANIEVLDSLNDTEKRWLKVRLIDGTFGWIQNGDIEKRTPKTLEEVVELTKIFLGLPYIWGGNSSDGYDCSGFVQTLIKQTGILLPRDSRNQVESPLVTLHINAPKKGDLIFFGDKKVTHVTMSLGDGLFIGAGVRDLLPKVYIGNLEKTKYHHISSASVQIPAFSATISPLAKELFIKIFPHEKSFNMHKEFSYIRLLHWDFAGYIREGEIVVKNDLANEVVEIFEEFFSQRFPIEKMLLIESMYKEKTLSSEDNNTNAFFSFKKSKGVCMNVLINPVLNPLVDKTEVFPKLGKNFTDRKRSYRGMIRINDPVYKAFISRGWKWAGDLQNPDYGRFYKNSNG